MKSFLYLAVCLVFLGITPFPVQASSDLVSLSLGYYDANDNEEAVDYRAEYRWGEGFLWQIKPWVGIEGTSEGAVYGLGGIYLDWGFMPHWYFTPSFGVGLYHDGGGKDLGSALEFRSQLELNYEFSNQHRLGFAASHISNADLSDHNPGTEILSLYYHFPISGD